jgi:hypothetical protein
MATRGWISLFITSFILGTFFFFSGYGFTWWTPLAFIIGEAVVLTVWGMIAPQKQSDNLASPPAPPQIKP